MSYQGVTPEPQRKAKYLVDLLKVNVDNKKLSDKEFRNFIKNSLPFCIIDFCPLNCDNINERQFK